NYSQKFCAWSPHGIGQPHSDWIGDERKSFCADDFVETMYRLSQRKPLQTYCRWALIRSYSHVAAEAEASSSAEATPDFKQTPSGWVPPLGKPAPPGVQPDIPFRVVRSRYGNLPVYLDYKSGGSRVLTIVRKVEGDAEVRTSEEIQV
ncbi:hypothetical protein GBAR_LOCUS7482, partial [Geodia barretti]